MAGAGKWLGGGAAALGLAGGGLALWSGLSARAAEAMVPRDGRLVDVACGDWRTRLHVVERGQGRPIVMVHGIFAQLRNFSYAMLDDLARDHRVILVDRPGWGYSTVGGDRQPDIAAQGAILAALIEALGLDRPLLVGHSLGGAVSLALALDHPELVRGLALIAPLTQPLDAAPEVFRRSLIASPALRALFAWTVAVPVGTFTSPEALHAVFQPDAVPADFGTRGGGALGLRPKSFQMGAFELSVAREAMLALAPRYPELRVPTAILYGRDDNLLDPELHGRRAAEAIPGATYEAIPGGHMLPVTWPKETSDWVRGVAARIGG